MYVNDPGKAAGDKAREMHKLAFPESYAPEVELNEDGTPKAAPEVVDESSATGSQSEPAVHDDLQTKYDALLAKFNSEVPRLHDWNRRKDEKIAALERQITESRTMPVSKEIPTLVEKDEDGNVLYRSPYVTDEMRGTDNYKYYLGEYGQTYAERQLESSVLAARSTVQPIEDRIENVNAMTAEEQFNLQLSATCPAWQGLKAGVNVDPEFIAWLQSKIPGSRDTLHANLVEAYQTADSGRMAEIINLYLTTKPTSTGKKNNIPDELIAPGKTGGGQQTVLDNNGGNVMRMSDMNQLYKDYQDGKYRSKEAEYQKKKAEFMKAKSEGRLIP